MSRRKRRTTALKTDRSYKYVPLYSKSAQMKDEHQFEQSMKSGNVDWKSFQRLMVKDICANTKIIDHGP